MRELMQRQMVEALLRDSYRYDSFVLNTLGWIPKRPKHTPRNEFVAKTREEFINEFDFASLTDEDFLSLYDRWSVRRNTWM